MKNPRAVLCGRCSGAGCETCTPCAGEQGLEPWEVELERLRCEVAELKAQVAAGAELLPWALAEAIKGERLAIRRAVEPLVAREWNGHKVLAAIDGGGQ